MAFDKGAFMERPGPGMGMEMMHRPPVGHPEVRLAWSGR